MGIKPEYDVVIVGAGPAGATTGKYLMDLVPDAKVAIVDKARQFPREKACGGYVGADVLKAFPYLQGKERHFIESESLVGILHSPDLRYQVGGRTRLLAILRRNFDAFLVGLAQQARAQVITHRQVNNIRVTPDEVTVHFNDGGQITAHAVVGADGATSIVARRTGLHNGWRPHETCRTVVKEFQIDPQYIFEHCGPDRPIHLYLKFNQIPGYAWFFPKAHHINVGLGCFANYPIKLFDYFQLFVRLLKKWEMLPRSVDVKGVKAGLCPTAGPLMKTQRDRVLLVGDAAGFVSPATGAGIIPGMISGQLAAETLARALQHHQFDEAFLKLYQDKWEQQIGRFKTEQLIQRIFLTNFCNLFIRIGERDAAIRRMIASAQSDSPGGVYGSGVSIPRLLGRVFWALLKGSFGQL